MSKGRRGGAKRRLRLQNDSPLAQHPLRVRPHPVSRLGMLPFRGTVFPTEAPAGGEITVVEAGVKNHGTTHGDNSQTLERGVTRGHMGERVCSNTTVLSLSLQCTCSIGKCEIKSAKMYSVSYALI